MELASGAGPEHQKATMVSNFLEIRKYSKGELTLEEEHIHKQYLCTADQLCHLENLNLPVHYLFICKISGISAGLTLTEQGIYCSDTRKQS